MASESHRWRCFPTTSTRCQFRETDLSSVGTCGAKARCVSSNHLDETCLCVGEVSYKVLPLLALEHPHGVWRGHLFALIASCLEAFWSPFGLEREGVIYYRKRCSRRCLRWSLKKGVVAYRSLPRGAGEKCLKCTPAGFCLLFSKWRTCDLVPLIRCHTTRKGWEGLTLLLSRGTKRPSSRWDKRSGLPIGTSGSTTLSWRR